MNGLGYGSGVPGMHDAGSKPVVNQALDSIMGMAVQMPALKKLGEELGLSIDTSLSTAGTLPEHGKAPRNKGKD